MTGIPGNIASLCVGKQVAKGTPQTTPAFRLPFLSGDLVGIPNIVELAETDSSRQQGDLYRLGIAVEGTSEHAARPNSMGLALLGVLGDISSAGSSPTTHTITPNVNGVLPYFTTYKTLGAATLVDQYSDLRIDELKIAGAAGGFITYSPVWHGLSYLVGQSNPGTALVTEAPFTYPEVTCSIAGSAPGTVRDFEVTISNGGEMIPGDVGMKNVDWVAGKFGVNGTMTLLFENDQRWRFFQTGSTTGTNPQIVTAVAESLSISIVKSASLSLTLACTNVVYSAIDIPSDPGGKAFTMALSFGSKRQAAIADSITATLVNGTASY